MECWCSAQDLLPSDTWAGLLILADTLPVAGLLDLHTNTPYGSTWVSHSRLKSREAELIPGAFMKNSVTLRSVYYKTDFNECLYSGNKVRDLMQYVLLIVLNTHF